MEIFYTIKLKKNKKTFYIQQEIVFLMDIKSTIKLNNAVHIPILGFGTWKIPNGNPAEQSVLWALETGYRHIDTARIYGNEESVGRAIKKSKIPREQLFITTKLWNEDHEDPKKALQDSLRRLDLDYVDLYLIHFPVPERNQSWNVLESLYKEGLCRSIGVSNFTIRHLEELFQKSSIVPAVNQVEFHPYLYQKGLLEYCMKKGIVLEAYSPLTHGVKLKDPRLADVAARYGRSPSQLLIRWCIQKGAVVLPKSVSRSHIFENADVFGLEISKDDMALLDGFDEGLRTCWDPTDAP